MNAIRDIVRALHLNSRAIQGRTGLSLAQLYVLRELESRPAASVNDLARRTATDQSSVSVVVKRLAEKGLLMRDADQADRRRRKLFVTQAGREYARNAPQTVQERLINGLQSLTAEERAHLAELLEQWLLGARIDLATPPTFLDEVNSA